MQGTGTGRTMPTAEHSQSLPNYRFDIPRFDGPALCAETDPEAFYPDKGGSTRPAKALCGRCEVRQQCLAYALSRGLDGTYDGVWGGTTPRERRRLRIGPPQEKRGRRSSAECGTTSGYKAHRSASEDVCAACAEANRAYNREYQYRTGRRARPTDQAGAA